MFTANFIFLMIIGDITAIIHDHPSFQEGDEKAAIAAISEKLHSSLEYVAPGRAWQGCRSQSLCFVPSCTIFAPCMIYNFVELLFDFEIHYNRVFFSQSPLKWFQVFSQKRSRAEARRLYMGALLPAISNARWHLWSLRGRCGRRRLRWTGSCRRRTGGYI